MELDELEKEAEQYRKSFEKELYMFDNTEIFPKDIEEAYFKGAEPREKRIADLEGQVTRAFDVLAFKRKRIEELEKENVQWKQRNETLKDALEHARKVYGDELEKSYKEIAELKGRECWKSCEYANPKSELIGQHIKDVQALTKAKELLKKIVGEFYYLCEVNNFATNYECLAEAEQFLKDNEVSK